MQMPGVPKQAHKQDLGSRVRVEATGYEEVGKDETVGRFGPNGRKG